MSIRSEYSEYKRNNYNDNAIITSFLSLSSSTMRPSIVLALIVALAVSVSPIIAQDDSALADNHFNGKVAREYQTLS